MGKQQLIRLCYWVVFLLCSAGILAAARGDLWLDEIWSLSYARQAHSLADVFTRFHHDNNHPLNTLFLHCIGEQRPFLVYRLLAVFSGIGSLAVAGWLARRDWGHVSAFCCLVLLGFCYPLLLYFSEARGYAPAVLFGLAAYGMLAPDPRQCQRWRVPLFWMFSILGILSHATCLLLVVAYAGWHLVVELANREPVRTAVRRLLAVHAVPLLFFLGWYLYFLRGMAIGGGPEYGTWPVVGESALLLLGLPEVPALRSTAVCLLVALVALGVAGLREQRDARWVLFPVVLFLSPALLLIVTRPRYLYFRYFLVCFPFFVLLLSYLVGRASDLLPLRWRWLTCLVVAGLVAGHLERDFRLLTLRRGNYAAAVAYMVDNSERGIVRVGSDNDFRNRVVFDFYASAAPKGRELLYVKQADWRSEPPDWILTHRQELAYQPPAEVNVTTGRYRLVKAYSFSGTSGWSWFLYRRSDG